MHDREKAIKALEIHDDRSVDCTECPYRSDDSCFEDLMEDILALLKEKPEIIRCKDCKHYDPDTQSCNDGLDGIFLPDWFCAGGERR